MLLDIDINSVEQYLECQHLKFNVVDKNRVESELNEVEFNDVIEYPQLSSKITEIIRRATRTVYTI